VRTKVAIPPCGLGRVLTGIYGWLQAHHPPGDFACQAAAGFACDAAAFYFRTVEDAQAFRQAFPQITLADGTTASSYSHPSGHNSIQAIYLT
jgi:hypothetical protein